MTTTDRFTLASRLSDELPDGVKIEAACGFRLNGAGYQWSLDVSDEPTEDELRDAARSLLEAHGDRIEKLIAFSPTGSMGGDWFAETA